MITFETQPDRSRLTTALRRAYRRMLLPFRISPFIALVPALFDLLTGDPVMAAVWAAVAVVLALVAPLTLRSLVQAGWKMHGIPITWTFTDEGVRTVNDHGDGILRWSAVTRVETIPGQLLVWINRSQMFPVPIDGLGEAERAELLSFLRARNL